jgi:hypothetical protein
LGYHKCGSHPEYDWVTDFRVLIWKEGDWLEHLRGENLPEPGDGDPIWFDLGGVRTSAALFEIRKCGLDGWWPSWNLAEGAFVLEGEPPSARPLRGEKALAVSPVFLDGLPGGLSATHGDGEVRYRSRYLEVGFCLRRAGFSYLSLDEEGNGRTGRSLLRMGPGITFQGVFLSAVGAGPALAPSIRYAVDGTTEVRGNVVTYTLSVPDAGQHYTIRMEVYPERILMDAERSGENDIRAWESSVWTIGLDARASPTTGLGRIMREGEAGTMQLPVILHAPAFGSLEVQAREGEALWRVDSFRRADLALHQLKLGERCLPEGDYLLEGGVHRIRLELARRFGGPPLKPGAPPEIVRFVERCSLTALSYRADTGTLSNNGNSMHCPLSMDNWSAVATRVGRLLPELHSVDLLRDSIERWLDGGPGYASGGMKHGGVFHLAEDEYLMTGTAALLGIAEYLEHSGTPEWLHRFGTQMVKQINLLRARDLDGDGLVESPYRTGVSGKFEWSTCYYDVISMGWKCAFSNALLYPALQKLAVALPRLGYGHLAQGLEEWAGRVREAYMPAFYNDSTGWLAGWRCKEGKLHDYGFLAINGAAVAGGLIEQVRARAIMSRIWAEARRVGMPDPVLGIPLCLHPIPDADLPEISHGFPFGYYQNGGLSTAQARHLYNGLVRVGMKTEADFVLRRIAKGLGEARLFGGAKSGVDARAWDGWPCGYEGLLTDQFGILACAIDAYGVSGRTAV